MRPQLGCRKDTTLVKGEVAWGHRPVLSGTGDTFLSSPVWGHRPSSPGSFRCEAGTAFHSQYGTERSSDLLGVTQPLGCRSRFLTWRLTPVKENLQGQILFWWGWGTRPTEPNCKHARPHSAGCGGGEAAGGRGQAGGFLQKQPVWGREGPLAADRLQAAPSSPSACSRHHPGAHMRRRGGRVAGP